MLREVDMNAVDGRGDTVLHLAARKPALEITKALAAHTNVR